MEEEIDDVVDFVYDAMCGPNGLYAKLRSQREFDVELFHRMTASISVLREEFQDSGMVPKKLAAAFVDITGDGQALLGLFEGSDDYEQIEDALHSLSDLGRELFED